MIEAWSDPGRLHDQGTCGWALKNEDDAAGGGDGEEQGLEVGINLSKHLLGRDALEGVRKCGRVT